MKEKWNLCKVVTASDDWLIQTRMEGRLVYMPMAPETQYCSTFRKQRVASQGIKSAMKKGHLYCNYGTHRPCDGKEIQ